MTKGLEEPKFGIKSLFVILRIGAMWPQNIWDRVYEVFMLFFIINLWIYRFVFSFIIYKDLVGLATSSVLMFTWCKGLIKYYVISRNKNRIEWIYASFERAYKNYGLHCKMEKYEEFSRTNHYMTNFSYFYLILTFCTAMSWLVQMFLRNLTDRDRELMKIEVENFTWTFHTDTWVPFTIHTRSEFWFWVWFHWYGNLVMVIIFAGVDPTYLLMLRYLLGHLKMLNLELQRASECTKHKMGQILSNCVQYHNALFKVSKEIEIICGLDIIFQCFSFIMLVSFTGYLITIMDLFSPQISKIYVYIIWCNIQIYVLIYLGNNVYDELMNSAFSYIAMLQNIDQS